MMIKEKFLKKYKLNELDYRNVIRFEKTKILGSMNMTDYLVMMVEMDINGGKRIADLIMDEKFYNEFLNIYMGTTLIKEAVFKNFEIGEGARYITENENMYIEIFRGKKGIEVHVLDYENDNFYKIPHYDIVDNDMKLIFLKKLHMKERKKEGR